MFDENYFIPLLVTDEFKQKVSQDDIYSTTILTVEKNVDKFMSNTTISLSATTKDVMVLRLFDEETLPIIGTDSISEEV